MRRPRRQMIDEAESRRDVRSPRTSLHGRVFDLRVIEARVMDCSGMRQAGFSLSGTMDRNDVPVASVEAGQPDRILERADGHLALEWFDQHEKTRSWSGGARRHLPNDERQRREPGADDVRLVSERNGWLPSAAPPGSVNFRVVTRRWDWSCLRRRSRVGDGFCILRLCICRSMCAIFSAPIFFRRGNQSSASRATFVANSRQPLSSCVRGMRQRHSSSQRRPPHREQRRSVFKPYAASARREVRHEMQM